MSGMSVADVLDAAASLIEPAGAWIQGEEASTNLAGAACYCAMGAVAVVCPPGLYHAAWGFARQACGGSVTRFNDDSTRTQAEVVAALRQAASLARTQSTPSQE